MKKKKGFDPFSAVMRHGRITIGTVGVMGVTGKMAGSMPSPQSGKIMSGMGTMKIVPTVHAASIGMGSLSMFEDVARQAKKRKMR